MLKIAYVYQHDAANPAVQSGRPASIFRQLTRDGVRLLPVFPMQMRLSRSSVLKKAAYRLAGRYYRGDREPAYLAGLAAEFERRIAGNDYDMVFCPGSEAISSLPNDRPVAFCADATFENMLGYYDDFCRVSREYQRQGHQQEANALARASFAIYPSAWAARSATDYYGTNPGKVFVIPFGANFGAGNLRQDAQPWIEARSFECMNLLFVGRSWKRKGGDLVVETARRLVGRGIAVRLDIVGCEPPSALRRVPWIHVHGALNPAVLASAARLAVLFQKTHFLFVPSRAEAYGMTFAEASAFAVPSISTSTGGIPAVVTEGVNGHLLPLEAGPIEYANLLSGLFEDRDGYRRLCAAAFGEFESRLNWRQFCSKLLALGNLYCGGGAAPGAAAAPAARKGDPAHAR